MKHLWHVLFAAALLTLPHLGGHAQARHESMENKTGMKDKLTISAGPISVTLHTATHQYEVTDARTNRRWKTGHDGGSLQLERAEQLSSTELALALTDPATNLPLSVSVTVGEPGDVTFRLETADYEAQAGASAYASEDVVQVSGKEDLQGELGNVAYPPALTADLAQGKMLFCDRSCGVYIDLDDKTYGGRELLVYGNTQCMDMPWIGVVEADHGDGVMLLMETPFDAVVKLGRGKDGRHWPQVGWLPSMGAFRYPRQASWRFVDEGGYVALAKRYRDYVRKQGRLVTLAEKAAKRPPVELLRGAPIIWGDIPIQDFIAQARPLGLLSAVFGNAHANQEDGAHIKAANEMGYITTAYDSIGDILEGAAAFQRDDVEKTAYVTRPGGGPQKGWRTLEGLQYYFRSSAHALDALKSYVPEHMKRFGFNGRFMDVALAMMLFEDYHPDHTFDRRQDQAYKRQTMEYFNSFGVVVGAEHGNDWGVHLTDYFEGATSGPFWWISTEGGWNAGHLKRPTARDQLSPEYIKYGMGHDARIPLWELVYHDCAVSTWYWGDTAGFMYGVAPDISERKDLINLLHGSVPLLWRNDWGFGWDENRERFMKTYHWTCKFHEQVFGARLEDHRFLTPDSAVQMTRFSSGHTAVVNFGKEPFEYDEAVLAPNGFLVTGPGFHQSRLLVEGTPVMRIETNGYQRLETERERTVGPITAKGTVTAFKLDEDQWNVVVEPGSQCTLDIQGLCGWPGGTEAIEAKADTVVHIVRREESAG